MIDRQSILRGRWRQGRWFLIALLLALASALVPALCTTGLPATRSTGSAFDPATSVVALRGASQTPGRTDVIQADDDPAKFWPGPILPLLPATPREHAAIALIHPGTNISPVLSARAQARRLTRAQPRAPPLLSV